MLRFVIGAVGFATLASGQLDYAPTATGVGLPAWDSGRSELEFADIDGDGHLDLGTVGDHGSPFINTQMHGLTIWFGNGQGHFVVEQTGDFGYGGVAFADVNDDGLMDAAYGVHHNYSPTDLGDQVLEVALGDGTGVGWTAWDDNLGLDGQSWGMFGTALADVDADGDLDVASVSFGCCDGFHLYLNEGDGSWTHSFGPALEGNSDMDIDVGDVNNDGLPDFATAHQSGTVWLSDGAGGLIKADDNLPGPGLIGLDRPSLGDVDLDGHDDISFANDDGGVEVWLRIPGGGWLKQSDGLPGAGPHQATIMADMNRDGLQDVVAFGSAELEVYLGDGGTSWALAATAIVPEPGSYAAMTVGDIDVNGHPDIAVLSAKEIDLFNNRNELRIFVEQSEPVESDILVTAPTTLKTIRSGAVVFVEWLAASPDGSGEVEVQISTSGDDGPWQTLGSGIPVGAGRLQVTLPTLVSTDDGAIRVILSTNQGDVADVTGPLTVIGVACPADCNEDGALDILDFVCFQGLFTSGDPAADCDGSGTLDILDFICFQAQFVAGCG